MLRRATVWILARARSRSSSLNHPDWIRYSSEEYRTGMSCVWNDRATKDRAHLELSRAHLHTYLHDTRKPCVSVGAWRTGWRIRTGCTCAFRVSRWWTPRGRREPSRDKRPGRNQPLFSHRRSIVMSSKEERRVKAWRVPSFQERVSRATYSKTMSLILRVRRPFLFAVKSMFLMARWFIVRRRNVEYVYCRSEVSEHLLAVTFIGRFDQIVFYLIF